MDNSLYEAPRLRRALDPPLQRPVSEGGVDVPRALGRCRPPRHPAALPEAATRGALRTLRLFEVTPRMLTPQSIQPSWPPFAATAPAAAPDGAGSRPRSTTGRTRRSTRWRRRLPRPGRRRSARWPAARTPAPPHGDQAELNRARGRGRPSAHPGGRRGIPSQRHQRRVRRYDSQRMVIEGIRPSGRDYVVLADAFFPGSKARVDGDAPASVGARRPSTARWARRMGQGPAHRRAALPFAQLRRMGSVTCRALSLVALAVAVAVGLRRRRGAAA